MITYREKHGDDIDGNRGTYIWIHELEENDEDVRQYLKENITDEDYNDTITVYIYSLVTEDNIEFEVTISDYLSQEEFNELQGELQWT